MMYAEKNRLYLRSALLMIILGAFYLRVRGIWFGYPIPVHADEPVIVERALKMVFTGDLNPDFFRYPSLNLYIQAGLYQLVQVLSQLLAGKSPAEIPPIWYYLTGRVYTVLLSSLTVFFTYLIGRRLFTPLAAICGACFVSVSYLHVLNSYLVTVDNVAAFWVTVTVYLAVLIATGADRTTNYLLAGVSAGLAIGSKYTACIALLPLLYAHYLQSDGIRRFPDLRILAALLAAPTVFLITTPYAIPEFDKFVYQLSDEARHYTEGHPGAQSPTSTSYVLYLVYIALNGFGIVPSLCALSGFIWMAVREARKAILLILAPAALFLLVGSYKVFFPRNLVAMLPFLSIFAGAFIYYLVDISARFFASRGKRRLSKITGTCIVLMCMLVLAQQLMISVRHIDRITLTDTRWISLQWIEQNLPGHASIGREHYTPPIEKYSDRFAVTYLGFFGAIRNASRLNSLDYVVVSSGDYERFLVRRIQYPEEAQAYLDFFARHELVREFVPDQRTVSGPRISIFRVRARE